MNEFNYDDYFEDAEDEGTSNAQRLPPYVNSCETSRLAAESYTTRREDGRKVWDLFASGNYTRDEVVVMLDETRYNTWTARFADLCRVKCLIKTGERRKTRRGRFADVLTRAPGATFEQFEALLRGEQPLIQDRRKWLKSLEKASLRWAWNPTPENEAIVKKVMMVGKSISSKPTGSSHSGGNPV